MTQPFLDGALERRFQPILVNEPTVDEAIDILNAVMPRYEEFHGVRYTPFAIDAAARLAVRRAGWAPPFP